MGNQPLILLPKTPLERRLEITAYLLLGLHFLLVCYYYPLLPERIPVHFNASGAVDRTGARLAIFQLPAIALILCAGLAFLARFPHKFNYSHPITPENAALAYGRSRKILWMVNVLNSVLFLALSWMTIRAAFGGSLSNAVWIVVFMLVVAPWVILANSGRKG